MRKRARFLRRVGGALMLAALVLTAGVPASAGDDFRGSRSIDPDMAARGQGVEWTRVQTFEPSGVEWTF